MGVGGGGRLDVGIWTDACDGAMDGRGGWGGGEVETAGAPGL